MSEEKKIREHAKKIAEEIRKNIDAKEGSFLYLLRVAEYLVAILQELVDDPTARWLIYDSMECAIPEPLEVE